MLEYCFNCKNQSVCFANHWCVTFDNDKGICDNYEEINKELKNE